MVIHHVFLHAENKATLEDPAPAYILSTSVPFWLKISSFVGYISRHPTDALHPQWTTHLHPSLSCNNMVPKHVPKCSIKVKGSLVKQEKSESSGSLL